MDLASRIVEAILEDLDGRSGVGDELAQIDEDTHAEMIDELVRIVKLELALDAEEKTKEKK
jgi:hypothetical protein